MTSEPMPVLRCPRCYNVVERGDGEGAWCPECRRSVQPIAERTPDEPPAAGVSPHESEPRERTDARRLTGEILELLRDAKRLDWLEREMMDVEVGRAMPHPVFYIVPSLGMAALAEGRSLRAAIDAAMSSTPSPQEPDDE